MHYSELKASVAPPFDPVRFVDFHDLVGGAKRPSVWSGTRQLNSSWRHSRMPGSTTSHVLYCLLLCPLCGIALWRGPEIDYQVVTDYVAEW